MCGETDVELFDANITHNLGRMAAKAGIYYALWRPEELFDWSGDRGHIKAKELIPYLKKGLKYLKSAPEKYKKYDSPNGWGLYEHFAPFVEKYLTACEKHKESIVNISR